MIALLAALGGLVLSCPVSGLDPLAGGIGARPLALGGAYVGLANDGAAIFTNPAGLADITTTNLISMYVQPEVGISFSSLGVALPERFGGTLAFSYRNRTTADISVIVGSTTEVVDYINQDIGLIFSKKVRDNISLGVGIRNISRATTRDIPSYEGVVGSGTVLDLGLKFEPQPGLGIGISYRGLGKINYESGFEDNLGELTVGASIALPRNLRLNIDVRKDEDNAKSSTHAGLEITPLSFVALRMGMEQTPLDLSYTTAGFGFSLRGITFDYAYRKLNDPAGTTEHYFSLGYVAPEKPKLPTTKEAVKPAYPKPEPKPVVARTVKRVVFKDMPDGHWAKESAELLATAGLVSGFPDGAFRYKSLMTRYQFSLIMLHIKNRKSANPPRDVGGEKWAKAPDKYVTRAEAARYLRIPSQVSRPKDPITRGEFAVLLFKTPAAKAAIKRLPPLE